MNSASLVLSDFARRLLRELRSLEKVFADKNPLVVAISGGADSAALLAAFAELKAAGKLKTVIVAAHFNHKLRSRESDDDAVFVEKLAKRFECDFVGGIWSEGSDLSAVRGNLEQAARRARYNFLARTAATYQTNKIFTAHTLEDQAETILMRLIRGSSAEGLSAMKRIANVDAEQFAIGNQQIVIVYRPFLAWARRAEIEAYCRGREIDFRVDAMNFDSHFARVRIRRELLPLLETFNPKIVETLARTARLLAEDNAELDKIARALLENAELAESKTQSPAVRRRVLRLWLKRERGSLRKIENKHLLAIERLFLTSAGESRAEIPGGSVVKKKGKLLFEKNQG